MKVGQKIRFKSDYDRRVYRFPWGEGAEFEVLEVKGDSIRISRLYESDYQERNWFDQGMFERIER